MCEIFLKNLCLGCTGLEYNIDEIKAECETYQRRITDDKSRNSIKTTKP